jgi:hypothetical protein
VRRSAPADARVIWAVTPVLPTTTARPLTNETTTITGSSGNRPIVAQQAPVSAHAAAIDGRTGSRPSSRTTPTVPSTDPTPYDDTPAAR